MYFAVLYLPSGLSFNFFLLSSRLIQSYSSIAETFPLDVREAEENFDLALIASLEIDVVPHLGDSKIPDDLVSQLGKILERGSKLYELEEGNSSPPSGLPHRPSPISQSSSSSLTSTWVPPAPLRSPASRVTASPSKSLTSQIVGLDVEMSYSELGLTDFGNMVPRERFSYWCFDLLFLICSDVTRGRTRLEV